MFTLHTHHISGKWDILSYLKSLTMAVRLDSRFSEVNIFRMLYIPSWHCHTVSGDIQSMVLGPGISRTRMTWACGLPLTLFCNLGWSLHDLAGWCFDHQRPDDTCIHTWLECQTRTYTHTHMRAHTHMHAHNHTHTLSHSCGMHDVCYEWAGHLRFSFNDPYFICYWVAGPCTCMYYRSRLLIYLWK